MNDDELRQRLQAMPEPTTTIDVDAVVADARRRRRPKVVGAGVAVGAACLAFLAPVVVPGLLGPDPVTATLQEQGAAEQAPAAPDQDAPTAAEEPEASVLGGGAEPSDAGSGGQEASGAAVGACAAVPASQVVDGLSLAFEAAPVGGEATLVVEYRGEGSAVVRIGDVGLAAVDGGTVLAAATVDDGSAIGGDSSGLDNLLLRLEPGDVERIGVDVATELIPCTPSGSIDGTLVPVVAVATGASAEVRGAVLGDPTAP